MKHWRAWHAASIIGLCVMPAADAEVFKCVNPAGKITYSEKKEANSQCSSVTTPINVVPAMRVPDKESRTPDSEDSGKKDAMRGQIAEQERALTDAKKALAEQESIRLGSEQNYQRVLDRLKPYQDKIAEIEKKLAQLREDQGKVK
ncbi:MAG: hypothetical protein IV108_04840 [Burkholderiales bacterium]|nr:hypothetical protein [Burkholderiales bacterium]